MADIWAEILSPIDKIYLYTLDDYGYETTTLSIYEDGWADLNYEITYSSEYTSSCDIEVYSSDENVATVSWSSDTVSYEGKIRVYGISEGTCTVTMKSTEYKNEYASVEVIVKAKPLKFKEPSIRLDKNSSTNKSKQLQYTNNTGKNVYFESSNKYYVTVSSSGLVTAVRPGSATVYIRTTDNKWEDFCDVTVIDSSDASVTITNGSSIPSPFYPGNEFKLEYQVSVKNISNDVTWSSEDSTVVSVNGETGLIKAKNAGTTKVYASLTEYPDIKDFIEVTVNPVPILANQFFWGKWTRMDKGTTYTVEETYVLFNGTKYGIISSNETTLEVETLGIFTKDSENVIKWYDSVNEIYIPFYRQGGTNLKYKVRVVGFEDAIASAVNANNISRAAASDIVTGKKNVKVKGQSERYTTYEDEGTTDDEGYVELTAPVQGDTQTLTIEDGEEITIVSGLKIENDGDFMGTIPVVKENEYSLKITGSVLDSEKTNGYLYANNYKEYPLTLILTNISEKVKSETSIVSISCKDSNVNIQLIGAKSGYTLDTITIPSMKPGATNEKAPINLKVSYGELKSIYKDVELDVRVENLDTGRVWVDYIPLRFFAGDMPVSIAAKATMTNPDAALNGFVIYPDGNSKFFTVAEDKNTTLWIPIFGSGHEYEMVFCGATVSGNLADSTEMYYTVAFDNTNPKTVDLGAIRDAYNFGEGENGNNSEASAFDITKYFADNDVEDKSFEAYLKEGDIDFYKFETTSDSTAVHK